MNKLLGSLFCFFYLTFTIGIKAQSIERYGFISAGSSSGSTIQIQSSIGELIVETEFATSTILTQGFVQSDEFIITSTLNDGVNLFNAFPNPTIANVSIVSEPAFEGNVEIRVMDISGKLIQLESVQSASNGRIKIDVDFSSLARGVYFINIYSAEKNLNQVLKITKI
jgi:hypothetical protein